MCSGFCALPSWSGWRCAWRSFGHYFELLSGTDQRQLEIIKLRVFVQRVARIANCHIQRAQHRVLQWPLEVGDCIAFHGLTVHGAPANASPNRRRAFSARFTGADARFVLRSGFMSPPPPPSGGPTHGAAMDSAAFPVLIEA